MANPEHLAILNQGVETWNEWRQQHPGIEPNLSEISIKRTAHLYGINLSMTDLSGSKLVYIDFTSANLSRADFHEANLIGARFVGTNLNEADLSEANLVRCEFLGLPLLHGLSVLSTNLGKINLSRATIGSTMFIDVDLGTAAGLGTLYHIGPSHIDFGTISRSQGKIPEAFLRGVGVPDSFLRAIMSLAINSLEYFTCFISYSNKDEDFAKRLYADLQAAGVRCWFAPEDLKIGDKFWHRIDESIRLYDKLLVVLSEHSVQSDWVEREVMAALEKEKQGKTVLFPITLDDAVKDCTAPWAADIRRSRHIGDYRRWTNHDDYQKAFERLLRDLKALS